jgi:hypothetical protein
MERRPRARAPWVAAVLALALTTTVAGSAIAEPFALLAAAKGSVTVTSAKGGTGSAVSFGRELERGDKLAVGPGGSATIYFSDGNVVELGERSTLTIGGRAGTRPAAGPGAALPAGVYANVAKFVTRGSRETGLVAQSSLRSSEAPPPMLFAPRRSDLIDDRPAFSWRAVDTATRYRITVSGEAGELWSRETREPFLAYPADAPALERDRDYLWRVDARSDAGSVHAEESVFHVVSEDIRGSIQLDLGQIEQSAGGDGRPAAQYLAGSYLSGRGLFHDAASRFEALSRIVPDSPAPHEALGNVYQAIGLMDRAAAAYQRALELTRSP